MNWRRILAAIALGGWLIFSAGIIWLGHNKSKTAQRNYSTAGLWPSTATISIEVEKPDPVIADSVVATTDHSLDCGRLDTSLLASILRSHRIKSRVITAFNADELTGVLGDDFLETGKTLFGGAHFKTNPKQSLTIIISRHRDPTTARLVAERFYTELLKYFHETSKNDAENAIQFLEKRKTDLMAKIRQAEAAEPVRMREADLVPVTHSQNQQSMQELEKLLLIDRTLLRNIENRIAETIAATTTPIPLPFHVVEARVVSGPFWNRTVTDFTADVAKLEKP